MRISRAAFLDKKKKLVFIFSVSQHTLKRGMTDQGTKMQKLEPAGEACAHGQQASMISY